MLRLDPHVVHVHEAEEADCDRQQAEGEQHCHGVDVDAALVPHFALAGVEWNVGQVKGKDDLEENQGLHHSEISRGRVEASRQNVMLRHDDGYKLSDWNQDVDLG